MSNAMKNSFKVSVSKDLGENVLSLYLRRVMEKFGETIYGFQLRNCTHCKNIFQPTIALCVGLYRTFVAALWTHEVIGGRGIYQAFYRRGQSSIPNDICCWLNALVQFLLITYHLNKATYSHSAILDTIQSKVAIAQLNKPQANCRNKEGVWESKAGKFSIGLLIATSRMPVFCDVRLSLDVSKEISVLSLRVGSPNKMFHGHLNPWNEGYTFLRK